MSALKQRTSDQDLQPLVALAWGHLLRIVLGLFLVVSNTRIAFADPEPRDFEPTSRILQFQSAPMMCAAISPDGKTVVTGTGKSGAFELVLWDRETQRERHVLPQPAAIRSVAFSPDGRLIAAGCFDKKVKLIDAATGKEIGELTGHLGGVNRVCFSANGKRLATGGLGGLAKVWEVATRKELRSIVADSKRVLSVGLTPDGETLATGGEALTVGIWNVSTGKRKKTLTGQTRSVETTVFSPDGKLIATGSWDRRILIWDWNAGALKRVLRGHTLYSSVAFSPNGKWLASASSDKSVKLWDLTSVDSPAQTIKYPDRVYDVAFTADGKSLLTALWDKSARLVDVATGREIAVFRRHRGNFDEPQPFTSVALSPDGSTIASCSDDETIKLRNAFTGEVLRTLEGHSAAISSLRFSHDGKSLASASFDRTAKTWDVATGKERQSFLGHSNWVFSVAFSPDDKTLATSSFDKSTRLWNIETGKLTAELTSHLAAVRRVVFSPDGKKLATAGSDRVIKLWDAESKKLLATLKGHSGAVRDIAFAPDGETLASGSEDANVKLWDLKTGTVRKTLKDVNGMIWSIAYSPRGNILAGAGVGGAITLWNPRTGKIISTLKGHTDLITSLAFASDTSALISGSRDKTMRRWIAKPPPVLSITQLNAHAAEARFVEFTPDGNTMITGGLDKAVRIWDLKTGELRHTLVSHISGVTTGALTPDGKTLATGSYDRTIQLWDVETGKWIGLLGVHRHQIQQLRFFPDGKRLASASWDQTARIWDIETRSVIRTLPRQTLPLTGLAISADGKLLATSTGNYKTPAKPGVVKIWSADSGKEIASLPNETKSRYGEIQFLKEPGLLATIGSDGMIRIWDLAKKTERSVLIAPRACAIDVAKDRFIVGHSDGGVSIWNASTMRLVAQAEGNADRCIAIRFLPSRDSFAVVTQSGTVKFWASTEMAEASVNWRQELISRLEAFQPPSQPPEPPRLPAAATLQAHHEIGLFVIVTPDGQRLISGGHDKLVRIWDLKTGAEIKTLVGHTSGIVCGALSRDGRILATGDYANAIRLWNVETGASLALLTGHENHVRALVFFPDGKTLVSTSSDNTVRLWDATNYKQIRVFVKQDKPVLALAVSQDGESLAIASGVVNYGNRQPGTLTLWDVKSGKARATLPNQNGEWYGDLKFSPDGKLLAAASSDHSVLLWDLANKKVSATLFTPRITKLDFSGNGQLLATSHYDGRVSVYDVSKAKRVALFQGHTVNPFRDTDKRSSADDVAFFPDSLRVASTGADGTVRLWNLSDADPAKTRALAEKWAKLPSARPPVRMRTWYTYKAHTDQAWFACFSSTGHQLATGSADKTVKIWDTRTRKIVHTLADHGGLVATGDFSPDGRLLATGSTDRLIKLWNTSNGKLVATLKGHKSNVRMVSFSPNGKLLASASEDETVRIWNLETNKVERTIDLDNAVWSVAFSADGSLLATGSGKFKPRKPGFVELWEVATGKRVRRFEASIGATPAIVFSPDGRLLTAVNRSGNLTVWDTKSGEIHRVIGPANGTRPLAISVDGSRLVSGHGDGSVKLWNTATGQLLAELDGHDQQIFGVSFSSDGKTVAAAAADGTVKLWGGQPANFVRPGSSLSFDGKTSYVATPFIPFDQLKTFTIEAWVRDWKSPILCQGQAGDPENSIWLSMGSRANQGVPSESCGWESGAGANYEAAVGRGQGGKWNHMAMSYDGTKQYVSINGKITSLKTVPKPGPLNKTRRLLLGVHHYGKNRMSYGSGKMGLVRVSNNARYKANFVPDRNLKPDEQTLLLYHFDSGAGTRVIDSSGNNRHGTIEGATWVKTDFKNRKADALP